jgi:hypothetical protein
MWEETKLLSLISLAAGSLQEIVREGIKQGRRS